MQEARYARRLADAMSRGLQLLSAGLLSVLAGVGAARAAPEIYEYRIIHSTHGEIGHYSNLVERRGDDTEVRTELHVAVKILGIVAYSQDARRTERWSGQQLASFDGVTVTNGDRLEIHGEARDGGFAITTPTGTVFAPASVHPSNPWCAMVLKTDFVMSTRTGKLFHGITRGGELRPVRLDGKILWLHQYEVVSDKREFVWLDDQGVPVAFRTKEDDDEIDFVLSRRETIVAGSG